MSVLNNSWVKIIVLPLSYLYILQRSSNEQLVYGPTTKHRNLSRAIERVGSFVQDPETPLKGTLIYFPKVEK